MQVDGLKEETPQKSGTTVLPAKGRVRGSAERQGGPCGLGEGQGKWWAGGPL